MLVTGNPDAYEEDFGDKPSSVEQAMYAAMMSDVRELIDQEKLPEPREESEQAVQDE